MSQLGQNHLHPVFCSRDECVYVCLCVRPPSKAGHSPVLLEEEGMTRGLPPDSCVNAIVGDTQAIAGQWLWVTRLQVCFPKEPVAITW